MNGVKDIRLRLQLTQQQLAGYLGISRSWVNLAEMNKRELSSQQWIRLVELAAIHEHPEKAARSFNKAKPVDEEEVLHGMKMENHARKCLYKAETIQRKLDKMKAQYDLAISWQQTMEQRLATLPETEEHLQERKWLEMELSGIPEKLRQCGELEQSKLRRKASLLRAEGAVDNLLNREMK